MSLKRFALAAIFLIGATVVPALAQGPSQERINFTINVPFELKKANVVLPPGNYVLFQIKPSDRYLFALYPDDLTHSPIAIISTIRIDYDRGTMPQKTRLLMDTEASPQNYPVLEGWNVPGSDGWQVIATTTNHRALAKLQARR